MARRRSQWQQFSDNYEAMNSTFNKYFSNKKTREIMDEEVVESWDKHKGIGPGGPNQGDKQWSYGGKSYDKQITPKMLTGLRNARLADVATRYGDPAGAMKMQLDQALLQKYEDESNLAQGTLQGNIERVKIENNAKIASMDLTVAQMNRIKTLQPYEVQTYLANIALKKQTRRHEDELQPHRLTKIKSEAEILEDKAAISDIDTIEYTSDEAAEIRDQARKNVGLSGELTKKELELKKDKITSTYEIQLATYKLEMGTAKTQEEATKMAAEENKLNQEVLTTFATKMAAGEFETPEAQKKWLTDNWTGDPRVKTMIENITAIELAELTVEGAKMSAGVTNALASGSSKQQRKALIKLMDMQDGIEGNMEFVTGDDGVVRLVEYPTKEDMAAKENGTVVINEAGKIKGWDGFTQQLMVEFTPLKSLELAKTNAEIRKINAEAKYAEGRVGEDQRAAQLKQWSEHKDSETYRVSLVKARAEAKTNKKDFDLAGWQEKYKQNWLADYPVIPEGVQVTEVTGIGNK